MDLQSIPMFALLRERMGWLTQRQGVLAQNVANANTPGYVAKDLAPMDFAQAMARSGAARPAGVTQAGHIPLQGGASAPFKTVPAGDERNPAGNAVSLEEQMMRVSDTAMEYQAASGLYKKALGLIRIAAGGAR